MPTKLQSNAEASFGVEIRAQATALFADAIGPGASLRFDAYAAADADGDDAITLEELDRAPSPDSEFKTLGDFLYDGMFPHMLRIGDEGTGSVSLPTFGR